MKHLVLPCLLALLPAASLRAQGPEAAPSGSAKPAPVSLGPGARVRLRAPTAFSIPGLFEGGEAQVRVVKEDQELLTLARDPETPLVLLKPGRQVKGRLVSLDESSVTLVREGTADPVRLDRVGAVAGIGAGEAWREGPLQPGPPGSASRSSAATTRPGFALAVTLRF